MSHTQEAKLYIETLQKDLPLYKDSIIEVSKDIRSQGYSKYPIFIALQDFLPIGELIIDRNDYGTSWNIRASTMEEFLEIGVIKSDKKEDFEKAWKNPDKFCCIFFVTPLGSTFVFVSYNSKKNKKSDNANDEFNYN